MDIVSSFVAAFTELAIGCTEETQIADSHTCYFELVNVFLFRSDNTEWKTGETIMRGIQDLNRKAVILLSRQNESIYNQISYAGPYIKRPGQACSPVSFRCVFLCSFPIYTQSIYPKNFQVKINNNLRGRCRH